MNERRLGARWPSSSHNSFPQNAEQDRRFLEFYRRLAVKTTPSERRCWWPRQTGRIWDALAHVRNAMRLARRPGVYGLFRRPPVGPTGTPGLSHRPTPPDHGCPLDATRACRSAGGPSEAEESGLFSGPPARAARAFQVQADGAARGPGIVPERTTAADAMPEHLQLVIRLRLVHRPQPGPRKRRLAGREQPTRHANGCGTTRQAEPHRHPSARSAKPARTGSRSTHRRTVHRCSSDCTGQDLNRP